MWVFFVYFFKKKQEGCGSFNYPSPPPPQVKGMKPLFQVPTSWVQDLKGEGDSRGFKKSKKITSGPYQIRHFW